MTKHRNLLALDLRFAETSPGGLRTAGVVGLVRDGEPPKALHAVPASWKPETPEATAARTIGETRGRIHAEAVRVASGKLDVEGEVDAIVSLLPHGPSRDRARYLLRGCLLQEDAFRATASFCQGEGVKGSIELLRIIEPACDRMAALADDEAVLAEAAANVARASVGASREFVSRSEEWRDAIDEANAPAPAP